MVSAINPEPSIRLGTGEIDEACYEIPGEYQGTLLNRLDATRLLTAVGKQNVNLKECVNWESVKKNQIAFNTSERRHTAPGSRHPHPPHHIQERDGWQVVTRKRHKSGQVRSDRGPTPDYPGARRNPWGHGQPSRPRVIHSPTYPGPPVRNQCEGQADHPTSRSGAPGEGRRTQSHYQTPTYTSRHDSSQPGPSHGWATGQPHPQTQGPSSPPPSQPRRHRRGTCYNCGETNHAQNNCRFDHKLRCTTCYQLGHKSRLCKYYNE